MNFVPKEQSRKAIKKLLEESEERSRKRRETFVERHEDKWNF